MTRPTRCEVCLRPTQGEACTRHPHDDLLDEEHDAHWLEALQEQRRQRMLRWLLPLAILFTLSLSFALQLWGLGLVGLVVELMAIMIWSRSKATPIEPDTLLPDDGLRTSDMNTAQWIARRNQRVERRNTRARAMVNSRVSGAG